MNHRPTFAPLLAVLAVLAVLALPVAAPAAGAERERLIVFFTSDVAGEVKSCGCPKLDYGGMTRRAAYLDTLRSQGQEYLLLDAGGITPFDEINAQKRLKAEYLAKGMARLDYDAVGLGDWDLAQGLEHVQQLVGWLGLPVVASNLTLPETVPSRRSVVTTVGEVRVGVVGFLDPGLAGEKLSWVSVEPWESKRDLVAGLAGETDYLIAFAAVPDSLRMEDLARVFPELDLIIGTQRGNLPLTPWTVNSTLLAGAGSGGKHLGRTEILFNAEGVEDTRTRYLPVEENWGRRPWMDAVITEYNRRVRDLLLSGG